jgi:hypothetical protein
MRQRTDGYVDAWAPNHPLARKDGYIFEHRMLAYDAGLPVTREVHVHHENHQKADNRVENLTPLDPTNHALLHAEDGTVFNQYGAWPVGTGFRRRHQAMKERAGDRHCEVCGVDINDLRLDATVCSNNCRVTRWKRAHR